MAFNISQTLAIESGRIGPKIYRETLGTNPWLTLFKKETWPDQMGYQVSVLLYNRSLITSSPNWTTISAPTGMGSGPCAPTPLDLTTGSTLRQYGLQMIDVRSVPFCAEFLRFDFQIEEQLKNVLDTLKDNVAFMWADWYRSNYTTICENKVIADDNLTAGVSSFPLVEPTSQLTFGILQVIRRRLLLLGGQQAAIANSGNGPVFGLITGMETVEALLHDNPEIREDLHFSSDADVLLKALGSNTAYRGWSYMVDDFPNRWDFVSGAWVQRWPWVDSNATYGVASDLNPLYENAMFEDAYVWTTQTAVQLVPQPISSYGSLTKFNPVNYMGQFQFLNIPNEDTNPLSQIGRYYGRLGAAMKPIQPKFGYVIRHLRCGFNLNLEACPTYAYPA